MKLLIHYQTSNINGKTGEFCEWISNFNLHFTVHVTTYVPCWCCLVLVRHDFDGLVQERRNSSALAMELRLSCTNSSIYTSIMNGYDNYQETKLKGICNRSLWLNVLMEAWIKWPEFCMTLLTEQARKSMFHCVFSPAYFDQREEICYDVACGGRACFTMIFLSWKSEFWVWKFVYVIVHSSVACAVMNFPCCLMSWKVAEKIPDSSVTAKVDFISVIKEYINFILWKLCNHLLLMVWRFCNTSCTAIWRRDHHIKML